MYACKGKISIPSGCSSGVIIAWSHTALPQVMWEMVNADAYFVKYVQ
jgi:hypothetical protein